MILQLLDTIVVEPVHVKDLLLGLLAGIALRRGRIQTILDKFLPTAEKASSPPDDESADDGDSA